MVVRYKLTGYDCGVEPAHGGSLVSFSDYDALTEERDRLAKANAELLAGWRADWHGVFLDGRNEHGSHVLMLPQRSIELEQDGDGNFLKDTAETILSDAEALGFCIGDAVVVNFDLCEDDGFFSHYEYIGVSLPLTEALYGSPQEQSLLTKHKATSKEREGGQ